MESVGTVQSEGAISIFLINFSIIVIIVNVKIMESLIPSKEEDIKFMNLSNAITKGVRTQILHSHSTQRFSPKILLELNR